jgi:hypothetical protein
MQAIPATLTFMRKDFSQLIRVTPRLLHSVVDALA